MNNPWLKLATFSFASILVIIVLLWGINSHAGYNSRQAGYHYNQYPVYPYDLDFTARSRGEYLPRYVYPPEYQNGNLPTGTRGQMQGTDNVMGTMNNMHNMDMMRMMDDMMSHMNDIKGNNLNIQNTQNNRAVGMGMM